MCKVDIGGGEIKDIVCGGINLKEGMRVAVSCPGAVVRWHGEGEPVVIKNSKLRGVESYGMICASDEIGLGELFRQSRKQRFWICLRSTCRQVLLLPMRWI